MGLKVRETLDGRTIVTLAGATLGSLVAGVSFAQQVVAGVTAEEAGYNPIHDAAFHAYITSLRGTEVRAQTLCLCALAMTAAALLARILFLYARNRPHKVRDAFRFMIIPVACGVAGVIAGVFIYG